MISRILITNNTTGNHDASRWALAAAEMVADVSSVTGARALDAQRLQLNIADVLEKHFVAAQTHEQMHLAINPKHVNTNVLEHLQADLDAIATEIEDAAAGTAWAAHYQRDVVKDAVKNELRHLFHSSAHLDRLNHCDKNPDCEHAQAYRAQHESK